MRMNIIKNSIEKILLPVFLGVILLFALPETASAATININSVYFPNDIFRSEVKNFDTNNDNRLSDAEIAAVTTISVAGYADITSLEGIAFFTALEELDCYSCGLTELDLSQNTALKALNASYNNLSRVALGGNSLTKLDLRRNNLTSINVSGFPALSELHCENNMLTGLTLGSLPNLTELDCSQNKLTALNISGCTALTNLNCSDNSLSALNAGYSRNLKSLNCSDNKLTSLSVNSSSMTSLNCSGNKLTALNISGCTSLTSLNCSDNNLSALDISGCNNLRQLYCSLNRLSKLDVSGLTELYDINCADNMITTFIGTDEWSASDKREYLNISGNPIKSIDISWIRSSWQDLPALLKRNPLSVSGNVLSVDTSSFDISTTLTWNGKVFFAGREDRSIQSITTCGDTAYGVLWDDGLLAVCGIGAVKDYSYDSAPWRNNSSVKALDIGENITTIGTYAFSQCLAAALVMHGDLELGQYACQGAAFSSVDFGNGNVRITGYQVFQSCKQLTELVIPENVSIEANDTFLFCSSLESVVLNCSGPLPDYTFEVCSSLQSVTINGNITSIGKQAFRGAPLKTVILPESVAALEDSAFARVYNGDMRAPDLTELRVYNPSLRITDNGNDSIYGISGIDPSGTKISAPACSTMAAYAQKKGFTFNAIDDSRHTEETIAGTPADCIHSGTTDQVCCSKCGYVITPAEEIAATGTHTWGEWEILTEVSCTADGERKHVCQVCNAEETEIIASAGHDYTVPEFDWYEDKYGKTPEVYKGHEWYPWYTPCVIRCSICGDGYEAVPEITTIMPEDEGGEYAKIIFIAEAKDPYNGNVYTDRYVLELWKHDEHTWGDWTIAEPASCTKKGLEERRCTECGVKETREMELTAHTEELRDAVEATCMSEGYSGDVYCSVCQGLLHAGSVIPIAAHTPVEMPATEPTCADPGYSAWEKCSYCGITLVERQETAPPTGQHDFEWTILSEPTCTSWGVKHFKCKNCEMEGDDNIEMLPHSFTNYVYNHDADCYTDGTETAKCDRCDAADTRTAVGTHGHIRKEMPATEATCSSPGYSSWVTCERCGAEIEPPVVTAQATGQHDYERTVISAPTCTGWGTAHYKCRVCGMEGDENIKSLDHTPTSIPAVAPTCSSPGYTEGKRCSVCGLMLKEPQEIPATENHVYGKWETTREASCTSPHEERRICTVCGSTEYRTADTVGHKYSSVVFEWKEDRNGGIPNTYDNMPWYSWGASGKCTCDSCGHTEYLPTTTKTYTPDDPGGQKGKIIFLAYSYLDDKYWTEQKVTVLKKVQEPSLTPENGSDGSGKKETVADTAVKQIADIPAAADVSLADKDSINTAVKAYEALSADQKKRIPAATVKKLEQAKKLLAEMEAEAEAEEKAGHKTVEKTAKTMAALSDNADPANSDYKTLTLKAKKISRKSIKLQWKKVKGAAGYIIYANKCGKKNQYQQVAEVKGGSKKSFTLKKIQSGKLKKNTYYKMIVAAYKVTKGGESRVIATSKSIHVATTGGKNGNPAKLTLNKKKVTVKVKKTVKLKAKQKAKAGTKIKKHRKISFESSNPKIATVSKKGVIKGKKKGKCTVYAYAQNGLSVKVKVTVK